MTANLLALITPMTALILSCSSCAGPQKGHAPDVAQEFDARKGVWKTAGATPQVTVNPPRSHPHSKWSAEKAGLQILRCGVMVAKTPIVGIMMASAVMAQGNPSCGVFDQMLSDFDPGPAMQSDLAGRR